MPGYTHFVTVTRCAPALTLELEKELERSGHNVIAGLDEVGRGSWAGPVVAAAVVLPLHDGAALARLSGVRDSKRLSPVRRDDLAVVISAVAVSIGVGFASHHVVDRVGIAAANRRAMIRAVGHLSVEPDALLVDYFHLPESDLPQLCVPKGDSRSLSIAAASIIAKTVRDRWIARCDNRYPGYDFTSHKGYGTASHRQAVKNLGVSPLHRLSFRLLAGDES